MHTKTFLFVNFPSPITTTEHVTTVSKHNPFNGIPAPLPASSLARCAHKSIVLS